MIIAKPKKSVTNVLKRIDKKYYWIVAAFLSSLTMYMLLSYVGLLKTGKYVILDGDAIEIYIPTIRNFCRNILNGESIYYSWNNSMGMNTSLNLGYNNTS